MLSAVDILGAAAGPTAVGERLATWLRPYPAKQLARMLSVKPRTARSWRTGSLPQTQHLTAMVERWGIEFLEYLFAPVLADAQPIEDRLERLERELGAIRREIVDAKASVPAGPAAHLPSRDGDVQRGLASAALPRAAGRIAAATARAGLILALTFGVVMADGQAMARPGRPAPVRTPTVRLVRGGGRC
jgi:hypothetical protein